MTTQADFLNDIQRMMFLQNDAELARWLGIDVAHIQAFREHTRIDWYTARLIADVLKIDPNVITDPPEVMP